MKKNAKALKKAAEYCSRFEVNESQRQTATNSTNAESHPEVSCKSCRHYDPSTVCSLNLYQEILENHHI